MLRATAIFIMGIVVVAAGIKIYLEAETRALEFRRNLGSRVFRRGTVVAKVSLFFKSFLLTLFNPALLLFFSLANSCEISFFHSYLRDHRKVTESVQKVDLRKVVKSSAVAAGSMLTLSSVVLAGRFLGKRLSSNQIRKLSTILGTIFVIFGVALLGIAISGVRSVLLNR
jgi:Na+/H+ antiporter NhaC